MSDLQSLSLEQLQALTREISAQRKSLQSAHNARMSGLVAGYVEDVVTSRDLTYSDGSPWAGFSDNGVEIEIEGEKFTFSGTVTHVSEKERRVPAHKKAVQIADEQKLTVDERKAFIAEAMKATEPVNA